MYIIDYEWLDSAISEFAQAVLKTPEQNNTLFTYDNGFFKKRESYKYDIYENARNALKLGIWSPAMIGTGRIFEYAMKALGKAGQLVFFANNVLRDRAYRDKNNLTRVEQGFFDLYIKNEDQLAFEEITGVLGYQYDKIAFFFFIKDREKYLPIRPTEFEARFGWLHISTDCTNGLSWEHYTEFIAIIREIGDHLTNQFHFESNLLNAHSFVWSMWLIEDQLLSKEKGYEDLFKGQGTLSADRIKEVINQGILSKEDIDTLIKYYVLPGRKATMRHFARSEGKKENEIHSELDRIGEKIATEMGVDGEDRPWTAVFDARKLVGDEYELRLKPEISDALSETCNDRILEISDEQDEKYIIDANEEDIFRKAKEREESSSANEEKLITVKHYYRDRFISEWAKCRANGTCDLCDHKLDYFDSKGRPYLEAHHIIPRADGGSDTLDNIVALCPNCHRKMHIANDPEDVEYLKEVALNYCLEENERLEQV